LGQGDYDSFAKYIRHAKKLSERENHDWGLAHSYRFLGIMAHINEDYEQAKHLHQRSLEISQQIGDQLGIATAWNNLGRAAQAQGKCDLALELYQKGLTYAQTLPYHLGVVLAACNAGMVHLQQESLMNAANSFVVALETALAIKTIPGMMHIFACIAGLLGHASWLGYDQMSALQLLLIANYHPTTHHETRRQVTAFLAQYDFTPPSEPPTWLEISYILDKANEVLVSIRQHISKNEID
jgi:tetratricopeptide (TPR) repeat protein